MFIFTDATFILSGPISFRTQYQLYLLAHLVPTLFIGSSFILQFTNENFINDNYGNILSDKCFTEEPVNSEDPDKTVSSDEITIISVECHLSASITSIDRSSSRRCSVRKGVLRNFAKFTGKHLCRSLFLKKVAGLRSVNFTKFLRAPFYRTPLGD